MKKTLLLSITAIFAMVLFLNLAAATITVTGTITNLAHDSQNFTITVESDVNETVSLSVVDITTSGSSIKIDFDDSIAPLNLIEGIPQSRTITYDIQSGFNFELGEDYSTTLTTSGSNSTDESKSVSFADANFCEDVDNEGELSVGSIEINTVSGFGDDDDYWYLRDTIEIEFDVENNGNGDVEKMDIEWAIYVDGEEVMDGSESITDLDENDDTTVKFEIKLDDNIDEFENGDVILYVKAFGDIDKNDNDALDGDETCDSNSESVDVITQDDFVIIDEFKINSNKLEDDKILSEKLECGSEVSISAQVWNIGEDDQDDVYVEVYSSLLGLYKKIEVGDIDAYDSFNLEYTFTLPEELDSVKQYRIQYEVFDEDNDIFENDEDDEAVFYNYFKTSGDCVTVAPTVGATLTSEAFSGKDMTVQATVRNNEPNSVIYTLSATGFENFAGSVSIEPQVISLQAGEEKTVNFNFKVSSSAEGDYSFNIETTEGAKSVSNQPVAVLIESKAFNLPKLSDKENLKLVGIIALNIIFVALIVVVARKILKRK